MKKLLLLPLFFISVLGFGQGSPYPNYQQFGSATTITTMMGAAKGTKGLVNGVYADTTSANLGYIDFYPGAQIFTTDQQILWIRNYNATRWLAQGAGITSISIITDSSVVICYGTGVCDTVSFSNFSTVVNNLIQNFTDSSVYNLNDSTLIICTGSGAARVCDTIHLGTTNTYFFTVTGDTLITCDTVQVICTIPDSCYQQQLCDTIVLSNPPQITVYQNALRKFGNIVEHGSADPGDLTSQLYHDTWVWTNGYQYNLIGRPLERPLLNVGQHQWSLVSSSIAQFNHQGNYVGFNPNAIDNLNPVNLYVNYIDPMLPGSGVFSGDTIGFMYDRIGYALMTNSQGSRSSYLINSNTSKQTGVLLHTLDTANTDAVTIFGNQTPNGYGFSLSPFPTTTLLDSRIAVFKTDGTVQFPYYPDTRNDGGTAKALYTDSEGNIKLGPVTGGDIITIINDTTFIICSFGTDLCDTVYVTNIGVLQTVTILNDSTLIVCDSLAVCDTLIVNPTVFSQPITANNGLIMSTPTNVQLGSPTQPGAPLLHQTYIDAGPLYSLNINGSVGGTFWVFSASNTGTGTGIVGNAISGSGVAGIATTGTGGSFRSTSGTGVTGTSFTSFAGIFTINPATTNTVADVLQINRQTSGTAADGIGQRINFNSQTTNGVLWGSNQIVSKWTTATTASRVSQFIITGVNNAITADLFTLSGNGETRLNKYGVGSFTSGTETYLIATKADGTLMEFPAGGLPGGGNLVTANNGLTASSATNVQLGQAEAAVGNPAILLNNREVPMGGFYLTLNASASQSANIFQTKNSSAAVRARITSAASFSNTGGQTGAEIFGDGATVTGAGGIVFGNGATASTGITIGTLSNGGPNIVISKAGINVSAFTNGVTVGGTLTDNGSTSIGGSSSAGASAFAGGASAVASGSGSTAVGANSQATAQNSVAINGVSSHIGSVAIHGVTTATDQFVVGRDVNPIVEAYWGDGVVSATPNSFTQNATGGSGTNIAGANFTLAAGKGTGNAASGVINFQTSDAGASGTTLQSLTTKAILSGSVFGIGITSSFTATRLNVVDNSVGANNIVSITSTSTAAASNLQKGLNVVLSGTNATSTQTTYGIYSSNTHAGTNSTNYAIYGTATGGTSDNYGVGGNGTSAGVYGTSDGVAGRGVYGTNASYIGVQGDGATGVLANGTSFGLLAQMSGSSSGIVLQGQGTYSSTNDEKVLLDLVRNTSGGTAAAGLGGTIRIQLEADDGGYYPSNEFISLWTDATLAGRTSRLDLNGVSTSGTNTILSFYGNKRVDLYGRLEMQQGADVASAAGAIALGLDGNVFEITGTAAITLLSNLNWRNGSIVHLVFTSTASVASGTATSGTDITILLAGAATFNASANDVLTLMLVEVGGTQQWVEVSRSVN